MADFIERYARFTADPRVRDLIIELATPIRETVAPYAGRNQEFAEDLRGEAWVAVVGRFTAYSLALLYSVGWWVPIIRRTVEASYRRALYRRNQELDLVELARRWAHYVDPDIPHDFRTRP